MDKNLFVSESKTVIEVISVKTDFSDILDADDFVVSAVVSVQVFSGIDPDPGFMIYMPVEIIGNRVSQRVRKGIVGVIYQVDFVAISNKGRTLNRSTRLAVIPFSGDATPKIISVYLTTTLYPIDVIETLKDSASWVSGRSLGLILDGAIDSGDILSGTLVKTLVTYVGLPEGITDTSSIRGGTLEQVLISYVGLPEGISDQMVITSGDLVRVLIVYENGLPEGIIDTISITAGTLT